MSSTVPDPGADDHDDHDAIISFDDDDEFAELFSFATSDDAAPKKDYSQVLASVMPLPPDDDHSEDSLLELLEQHKDPVTVVAADGRKPSQPPSELVETNTQELLDWLDQEDDDQETARQRQLQLQGDELIAPPSLKASTVLPTVVSPPPEPEPQFQTLEEAVKSPKASLTQIRSLLQKEQFQVAASIRPHLWCRVICGKTLDDTLASSVADSFQQWEQHNQFLLSGTKIPGSQNSVPVVEGAVDTPVETEISSSETTAETSVSLEDSTSPATLPEESKEGIPVALLTQKSPTTMTPYQQAQQQWIEEQSTILADRIVTVLKGEKVMSQKALASLLLNHYHTGQTLPDDDYYDDNERRMEAESNSKEGKDASAVANNYVDPLLPPVACTILSAGVPKAAAAVMLTQIVPHFMPILALTRSEREQAAQVLHRQFYLLACYHLPSLVLHLDRYLPNWFFWPNFTTREKDGQGFVPQSYLISHLAGECAPSADSPLFMINPKWLLALWDLILTSSNNSLRFFLVLAVLEAHADQLVLLTDEPLKQRLKQVLSFQQEDSTGAFAIQDTEAQTTFHDATKWVQEWTDKAQILWERTPVSVARRLKRLEDQTVTETLTKRQQEKEEKMKRRLEAQAKAHQEAMEAERERKADEARLRLTRARLVAFYRQYNPGKETNIEKIMETYQGRYEVLDAKLKQKYGVGFNPAMKPKTFPARTNSQPTTTGFGTRAQARTGKDDVNEEELAKKRKRNQIVVKVAPSEVLPVVCWSKTANKVRMTKLVMGNKLEENIENRLPLKFYLVDTRPTETAQDQGRFPTSVNFPPEDLTDPDRLREQEEMFEALRGAIHIVIMGEGFAALPSLYGHKMTAGLSDCIREDDARNNNCALFFLKKGFPFVSLLDGGFAAAHAFLCREGTNHHLRVNDVLENYNPDVSIFGQFERVHNSSGREKAQRALQNIFDSSLIALTKNARRLETLASEIGQEGDEKQQQKKSGGNMVARFFATGVSDDAKKNTSSKAADETQESVQTESDGKGGATGSVFRNPFARINQSQSSNVGAKSFGRENSSSSLDVESVDDLDTDTGTDASNKAVPSKTVTAKPQPSNAFKNNQPKVNAPESPKVVEQRKVPELPKANPFAGFGAALKAASKVASGDGGNAGNRGRVINPFARFNVASSQHGKNLDISQHGTSQHGNSQHGMNLGTSQHGKKGDSQGSGIAMAKNFAGLNQFRLNTFSRIRSTGDSAPQEDHVDQKDDVTEESLSFDQTVTAVAVGTEPELVSATVQEEPDTTSTGKDENASGTATAAVERV